MGMTLAQTVSHAIKRVVFNVLPPSVREAVDLVYYEKRLSARTLVDEEELELLPRLVKRGDAALDIGANLGAYTLLLHELVGPTGTVDACEPVPRSFRLLVHNCHKLAQHKNITFHEVAVGEREGETSFYLPVEGKTRHPNYYVGGLVQRSEQADTFPVRVVSLDDWTAIAARPIGFVKIDVEGAEVQLLRGALQFLAARRPSVVCEIAPANVESVRDLVEPLGYRMYIYRQRGLHRHQRGDRPGEGPNYVLLHEAKLPTYDLAGLLADAR